MHVNICQIFYDIGFIFPKSVKMQSNMNSHSIPFARIKNPSFYNCRFMLKFNKDIFQELYVKNWKSYKTFNVYFLCVDILKLHYIFIKRRKSVNFHSLHRSEHHYFCDKIHVNMDWSFEFFICFFIILSFEMGTAKSDINMQSKYYF